MRTLFFFWQACYIFTQILATMDDRPHCIWSVGNPGNNYWSPRSFSGNRLVNNSFKTVNLGAGAMVQQ